MIQIRGIDHVVLRVADLDAMLEFYCKVLGCSIERQQEELGLTQLRAGSSLIDLVTVEGLEYAGRVPDLEHLVGTEPAQHPVHEQAQERAGIGNQNQ